MPFKLQVGSSRKLDLANYGSVGASCAAEVKMDSFVDQDVETT